MGNDLNGNIDNEGKYAVEDKKSNLFNIIIGIATLLIAILGATFAYFSATASSKDNDVSLQSAYLSIDYEGGTKIEAKELIPSSLNVALTEYMDPPTGHRCIDEKGKEVCYVYQFSVTSKIDEVGNTDIVGSIKVNDNGFSNLSYILYEVTFETDSDGNVVFEDEDETDENYEPIEKVKNFQLVSTNFSYTDTNSDITGSIFDNDSYKFNKFSSPVQVKDESGNVTSTTYPVECLFGYTNEYLDLTEEVKASKFSDSTKCASHSISNGDKHTFQLVIWLEETGEVQDEQKKTFAGTVNIDVSGSLDSTGYEDGHITGSLSE